MNFGPLAAEIDWRVWGTPANFNGFRVLPSLLQRRHSSEANQTLHHVWRSPGLLHYINIFLRGGVLTSDGILPRGKFTLRPSLAFSYIGRFTAWHSSSRHQPNCSGQQTAPPVFARATITLGIGSWHLYLCPLAYLKKTRMWANAQPDGRPAEHRWRPLFNAAKFG